MDDRDGHHDLVLGANRLIVDIIGAVLGATAGPPVAVLVDPGEEHWCQAAEFDGGIVVVVTEPGEDDVVAAVHRGADAVVDAGEVSERLAAAVRAVRAGEALLTPRQTRVVAGALRRVVPGDTRPRLSKREGEIVRSIAAGHSVKQTAILLGITPKTVENLSGRLFRKLEVRNRARGQGVRATPAGRATRGARCPTRAGGFRPWGRPPRSVRLHRVMTTIRVLLGELSALIRSLLRVAFATGDVTVVGETATLAELVELCEAERPDVVVTNCTLRDRDLDGHLDVLAACDARVLVLAPDASPEPLTGLLAGGVSGYLVHDTAPEAVVDAVVAVAGGAVVLHPVAASLVVDQWRRLRGRAGHTNERLVLTSRELDVLAAMADGLSTKAIARHLGVAVKTVENHETRVFDKLGVRTQAHAVGLAISQGLLHVSEPEPMGSA